MLQDQPGVLTVAYHPNPCFKHETPPIRTPSSCYGHRAIPSPPASQPAIQQASSPTCLPHPEPGARIHPPIQLPQSNNLPNNQLKIPSAAPSEAPGGESQRRLGNSCTMGSAIRAPGAARLRLESLPCVVFAIHPTPNRGKATHSLSTRATVPDSTSATPFCITFLHESINQSINSAARSFVAGSAGGRRRRRRRRPGGPRQAGR